MTTIEQTIATDLAGENSVHIGVPRDAIPFIEAEAARRGMTYHCITFPPGTTLDAYFDLLSVELEFPTKAVNSHDAMDWLGDLTWFDNTIGHVVVFDGLAGLVASCPGALRGLAGMLPESADRIRSGGWSFHAILIGTDKDVIDKSLFDINDVNGLLERSASGNPSYPVKVVNHAADAV